MHQLLTIIKYSFFHIADSIFFSIFASNLKLSSMNSRYVYLVFYCDVLFGAFTSLERANDFLGTCLHYKSAESSDFDLRVIELNSDLSKYHFLNR